MATNVGKFKLYAEARGALLLFNACISISRQGAWNMMPKGAHYYPNSDMVRYVGPEGIVELSPDIYGGYSKRLCECHHRTPEQALACREALATAKPFMCEAA